MVTVLFSPAPSTSFTLSVTVSLGLPEGAAVVFQTTESLILDC